MSHLLNNTLQKLYYDYWSQLFSWNGSETAGTVRGTAIIVPNGKNKSHVRRYTYDEEIFAIIYFRYDATLRYGANFSRY